MIETFLMNGGSAIVCHADESDCRQWSTNDWRVGLAIGVVELVAALIAWYVTLRYTTAPANRARVTRVARIVVIALVLTNLFIVGFGMFSK